MYNRKQGRRINIGTKKTHAERIICELRLRPVGPFESESRPQECEKYNQNKKYEPK